MFVVWKTQFSVQATHGEGPGSVASGSELEVLCFVVLNVACQGTSSVYAKGGKATQMYGPATCEGLLYRGERSNDLNITTQ